MNQQKSPCVLQDFVPFGVAAQKRGEQEERKGIGKKGGSREKGKKSNERGKERER